MNKKVVIVTGAYGKIGFAIARDIALKPGYRLTLVGRSEKLLVKACREIIAESGNTDISYQVVDLSIEADIHSLANHWQGPLHILVNNAASCPLTRTENAEGIEMQFATNVLGYYRMIMAFESILRASAPARIINVASYWAGELDMNDPEFKYRRYDNNTAYRQSKQADRMLSAAFAGLFDPSEITVNACHPGDVNSQLSNSLGFGGHESPGQGAATPVWLATSTAVTGISGKYFEHLNEHHCRFSTNMTDCKNLLKVCSSY